MRWLGITAAVAALLAAVLNTMWFVRSGIGFGAFLSLAGPAALGTVGFMAFTVLLGIVTVRMMLRRDAEDEAAARARGEVQRQSPVQMPGHEARKDDASAQQGPQGSASGRPKL